MGFFSDKYRRLPHFKGKKRLGRLLFKQAIYQKKDLVVRCKHGLAFHVLNTHDSVGRDLFFDGEYEPRTVSLSKSLLQEGDVMVDAGANIGAISLPVAKEKNITVYAFEPGKKIFEVLEKNIALNGIGNVKAVQIALSDKEGITDFYESDRVHGWSGIVKIESFNNYTVKATTLDAFAAQNKIEWIKVLKADVQGWEYHVFKGAEKLLDEKRINRIIFEFEWWAEKNAGLELGAAQKFLIEKGYSLTTLDGVRVHEPILEGSMVLIARFD